jgi:hypothetical protein
MKSNLKNLKKYRPVVFFLFLLLTLAGPVYSQVEVEPWGNITGIRKDGQLFEFESSLRVKYNNGRVHVTAMERQQPRYKRYGDRQEIATRIDSLFFKESVQDVDGGRAKVSLNVSAHAEADIKGVYFCITFPGGFYKQGHVHLSGDHVSSNPANDFEGPVSGFEYASVEHNVKVLFDGPEQIIIKKDTSRGRDDLQLYVALKLNGIHEGETIQKALTIDVSGEIDKAPVKLTIDTRHPGRKFDGLGGNFRLQNPKGDPQVIDYSLKNMRVAWGRVEMPWRFWQPDKDLDPTLSADSGKLNPAVKKAMEMAHRLDSLHIPFILSAWFPPGWAAEGSVNMRPINGVWGNPLNKENMGPVYKSIADYILYLKSKYGAEPRLFSFNESDLGINVRVTAQEHDDFIKGCGAYFAAHGINTKMLLGDNSDATTYKFIDIAMNDPAAKPYIGAISFHSWRGWDTPTLQKWADAATRLQLPLLVGEGSIDAAAWNYPDIFQEQTYALKEINLYVRLLAVCQPLSILQWQLTSDYSPLIGGGIFGNNEPLHPGQRFWNLKQLSITPKGLFAMPVTCSSNTISCAAEGDNSSGKYTIQLVNNDAERSVTLTGLPGALKQLHFYSTSKTLNMHQSLIKVVNGAAKFRLPATSYVTLISE